VTAGPPALAPDLADGLRRLKLAAMRQLAPDEIARYVASNEWQSKAGGYGIQDQDPFVTRIAGCHTNIVGLPMELVTEFLTEAGIQPSR